jgi:hypothetical protein
LPPRPVDAVEAAQDDLAPLVPNLGGGDILLAAERME